MILCLGFRVEGLGLRVRVEEGSLEGWQDIPASYRDGS